MKKHTASSPVFVTQSVLPPLEAFVGRLATIFQSHQLTNQGEYVTRLERRLSSFLNVPMLALCANGTLGLQLALRLLELNGKTVLTTPFTYVATLSALLWEGCTPVFADIDPQTLCIDPHDVERKLALHPEIAGIVPVHVFGNACDVDALGQLAARYGVKLLYDAAHAFGSTLRGQSLFAWGDAAVGSFHATKLFHTVEGGCIVTPHASLLDKLHLLRAFGHCGDEHVCLGINAKMSELHAAMGDCLLDSVPDFIAQRAEAVSLYNERLPWEKGLRRPQLAEGLVWNFAYYPVIFATREKMFSALHALQKQNIYPRRYFYPSLTSMPYITSPSCPITEDISERILCLPLWPRIHYDCITQITSIISQSL